VDQDPYLITEEQEVVRWRRELDPWFNIEEEVWGTHYTGRRVRIDMMLHPKFAWRGGSHYPIGFEIKKPVRKQGHYIGQALDYACSRFESLVYSPESIDVFIAVNDDAVKDHGYGQVFGGCGVIYLGIDPHCGLNIRVSYNRHWSAVNGVVSDWSARRKYGSR